MQPGAVIVAIATLAACAPPPAQLVTERRWPEACARHASNPHDVASAVLTEIASSLTLDVQVLDRTTLEHELGVPIAGELFDRIAIVRASARAPGSILQASRVTPIALDDGRYGVFARWPLPVRALSPEDATLFEGLSHEGLSERGMAALLVAPDGLPGYATPLSVSVFDPVPVPFTGGKHVRTFREGAQAERERAAVIARNEALDARAAALEADPIAHAAIVRLRDHLAGREWFLLLPGGASDGRGLRLSIGGRLGGSCPIEVSVDIDLARERSLGQAVNERFPHPRSLAELPWRISR